MPIAHTHHDLEFNLVRQGQIRYLVAGRVISLPPNHLTAIWGAIPHQTIDHTDDLFMVWGTMPLEGDLLNRLTPGFVQELLTHGLVTSPVSYSADELAFTQWEHELGQPTPARKLLVQHEMELRLVRLSLDVTRSHEQCRLLSTQPSVPSTPSPSPLAFIHKPAVADEETLTGQPRVDAVVRMTAYIAAHYTEPISVADVVAQAHLHPNYAMTLFARHTQMTIITCLTRQRIAHAQRLLATSDQPILDIGQASGFRSTSRFFEAFKQLTGLSPRAYRQQMGRCGA